MVYLLNRTLFFDRAAVSEPTTQGNLGDFDSPFAYTTILHALLPQCGFSAFFSSGRGRKKMAIIPGIAKTKLRRKKF
jgi:hypothetical protein